MAPAQSGCTDLLTQTGSWSAGSGADALRPAPGCVRKGPSVSTTAARVWGWESRNTKTLNTSEMVGMALLTVIGSRLEEAAIDGKVTQRTIGNRDETDEKIIRQWDLTKGSIHLSFASALGFRALF